MILQVARVAWVHAAAVEVVGGYYLTHQHAASFRYHVESGGPALGRDDRPPPLAGVTHDRLTPPNRTFQYQIGSLGVFIFGILGSEANGIQVKPETKSKSRSC